MSRSLDRAAMLLIAVLGFSPLLLDSYSRLDLSTSRDGPYVLGFTRESLKAARRLGRGETVIFDPQERKFAWGTSPPNELARLRFFLRDGFGPVAHYGTKDVRMLEPRAWLVAPLFKSANLKISLTLDAQSSSWMTVFAGATRVGEVLIGPQAVQATFEIPAASLFRGDNLIELRCDDARKVRPRLLRVELRQPSGS